MSASLKMSGQAKYDCTFRIPENHASTPFALQVGAIGVEFALPGLSLFHELAVAALSFSCE